MSTVDTYGRNTSRRVSSRSSSGRSRSRSARRRRSRRHRSKSSHRSRSHHRSPKKKPLNTYEYSDDASDDEFDKEASRAKNLKKIDVDNPLSAFSTKTKTRLSNIAASFSALV